MQESPAASPQQPRQTMLNKTTIMHMARDMNFLAIIGIIYGVFNCLTIIGIAWGLPVIFAALRLRESSEAYKSFVNNNFADDLTLQYAFEKQARALYIYKILTIISLALLALYLIFIIIVVGFMGVNFMENFNRV
jgi:hypothetical protein